MWRRYSVALFFVAFSPALGFAQDWARQMFKVVEHDFGNVASGAKAEFEFEAINPWVEDVHLASVTSSCGCTTPRIENPTIKSWEKAKVVAHFNSDRFTGRKSATLTVNIDRPFPAQVQLHVGGLIRNDIAFNPTSVDFGAVAVGTASERLVNVGYSGFSNWQITGVRSANPHLKGEVTELSRQNGQVLYQLTVRLDKKAPEGYLHDFLMLTTADQGETPILVEGRVESQITASPGTLMMGVVEPGQKTSKPIVLKGKQPFRITKITCAEQSFQCAADDKADALHVVPVTFQAGSQSGKIRGSIRIETDSGKVLEVPAYAVVAKNVAVSQ